MNQKNIGSTLDSLFEEIGEIGEMNERLSKRIFVEQFQRAMRRRRLSLSEVARRMGTSRPAVYRLLDPSVSGVTLESLVRASTAVGMAFEPRLIDARKSRAKRTARKGRKPVRSSASAVRRAG